MPEVNVTNPASELDGRTLLLAEVAKTITALMTFDRGAGNAPLAIGAGAAMVANLDVEKLGGQLAAFYRDASNLNAGIIPAARFPNPLPGVSGENLVNLNGLALANPARLQGFTSAQLADLLSASGEVRLAYDTTTGKLVISINGGAYAAIGGGGDASQLVFRPQQNQPGTTAYSTFDLRNSHPILCFDATTAEDAIFGDVWWPDYDGENVEAVIMWAAATATSGSVRWDVAVERLADGGHDMDSDSFATAVGATGAAPGTAGIWRYTTVTLTSAQIDGLLAGEGFRIKVTRNTTHGDDGMSGDAQIARVVLRKV